MCCRWPHTHCAVTDPYTRSFLFVCDLGQDKVLHYCPCDVSGKLIPTGEVFLEKGTGPRHLVFHPTLKTAYVVNELRSTVSVFSFQPQVSV